MQMKWNANIRFSVVSFWIWVGPQFQQYLGYSCMARGACVEQWGASYSIAWVSQNTVLVDKKSYHVGQPLEGSQMQSCRKQQNQITIKSQSHLKPLTRVFIISNQIAVVVWFLFTIAKRGLTSLITFKSEINRNNHTLRLYPTMSISLQLSACFN